MKTEACQGRGAGSGGRQRKQDICTEKPAAVAWPPGAWGHQAATGAESRALGGLKMPTHSSFGQVTKTTHTFPRSYGSLVSSRESWVSDRGTAGAGTRAGWLEGSERETVTPFKPAVLIRTSLQLFKSSVFSFAGSLGLCYCCDERIPASFRLRESGRDLRSRTRLGMCGGLRGDTFPEPGESGFWHLPPAV